VCVCVVGDTFTSLLFTPKLLRLLHADCGDSRRVGADQDCTRLWRRRLAWTLKNLLLSGFWTKLPPNPTRLANVLGSFLSQFEFNKVTAILVTRSMQKSARLAEEREIDCCSASN
jgi:hypothetical protein